MIARGSTRRLAALLLSSAAILLVWSVASRSVRSNVILPAPEVVLRTVGAVLVSRSFLSELGTTAIRVFTSLAIVLAVAIPVGVFSGRSDVLSAFLSPVASTMRTTPVIAVILLALIWFTSGVVPIFVTLLMTAPIVYEAARSGARETPDEFLEMARTFGVGPWKRFMRIVLPAAFPSIVSGFRTAHGIAWKVCVAAEVLSQPRSGIGTRLNEARIYLETERLVGWVVILVVVSGAADRILHSGEDLFRKRRGIHE